MASSAKNIIENIIAYIEVKTEQIKLRIITRVARMLSNVLALSISVLFGMFFVFFLSFAFAELINTSLQSTYYGFFIVAAIYLIIIAVVLLLVKTKRLQHWIEKIIVNLEEARYEQETDD